MTPLAIALQWVAHLARREADASEDQAEYHWLLDVCAAAGERSFAVAGATDARGKAEVRKAAWAAWCAT